MASASRSRSDGERSSRGAVVAAAGVALSSLARSSLGPAWRLSSLARSSRGPAWRLSSLARSSRGRCGDDRAAPTGVLDHCASTTPTMPSTRRARAARCRLAESAPSRGGARGGQGLEQLSTRRLAPSGGDPDHRGERDAGDRWRAAAALATVPVLKVER